MRLLRDHDTASEEEAIKRHGLDTIHLDRPVTSKVRPEVIGTTEAGTTDENKVGMLADRAVGRENRLVEILARMVTSSTTASPLHDDREVRVRGGDVDHLTNAIDRAGLEGDVLDASVTESIDDLGGLLRARDASSNTEAFHGETFAPHLLPERELEAKLARVDVESVESDADAGRDVGLDLGDLRAQSSSVIMSTASELNMVPSIENGADETGLHGRGGHTCNHDGRLAEQAGERSVDMDGAIAKNSVQ